MFFKRKKDFRSQLFNEKGFYSQFINDLLESQKEVIIESPYITSSRMEKLLPTFEELLFRRVNLQLVTKDPSEHDDQYFRDQATNEILRCMDLGIKIVLIKGNHHRKLAIMDRKILWEGSLNILSYNKSQEIMRRIEDEKLANQMFNFLGVT